MVCILIIYSFKNHPAFYSELQHNRKGQLISVKIVNEKPLTINLINSMPYSHFTPEQRNELSALIRARIKKKDIACQLGKDRSTIWRELNRNKTNNKQRYDARRAKEKNKSRRISANSRFRKLEHQQWLRNYVNKKIKKYWSPEQIAGRLKRKYPHDKTKHIGKDSIYKYIYNQRKDLVKYLRCQKGKYRRRYGTRIREKQREELEKRRIDERPEIVETRRRIGDWEGDTVIGQDRKPAILTHVERKSGLLLADKLNRALAETTKQKTIDRFSNVPKNKKHTLTYDNGSEFAEHEMISQGTKMDIYFAYPYHSWERGSNENANGLLRQFFPKKTIFATITQEQIEKAVKLINNRPRKRHNYLTPYEVFNQKTKCCTLE
jgi:transposase, IS30 family